MLWKDVGYLLKEKNTIDELHRPRISYEEIKVICNIKSIGQSEFYQAQATGFKPELKIEIKCCNLTPDINHFKINDKIYKILRTYEKEDIIELILTSLVVENEQ